MAAKKATGKQGNAPDGMAGAQAAMPAVDSQELDAALRADPALEPESAAEENPEPDPGATAAPATSEHADADTVPKYNGSRTTCPECESVVLLGGNGIQACTVVKTFPEARDERGVYFDRAMLCRVCSSTFRAREYVDLS